MFRQNKKLRRSAETRALKLRLESLEERQLLNADPAFVGPLMTEANEVIVVNTLSDESVADEYMTLREAISQAGAGDTITFAPSLAGGTIYLNGTELVVDKAITINASSLYDEASNTPGITIDAGGKSRVAKISAGTADAPVVFNGLTLQNGYANDGGGVYVADQGTFKSTNSIISDNSARGYGGGVWVSFYGTFTSTNLTISGNSAGDDGGGVYVVKNGTFTSTNSTIFGNSADGRSGGGVYVADQGTFTSTNSTIFGNSADGRSGGGVYVDDQGTFTSTNSTISGNSARGDGGGVYVDGTFTSTNSTISGNSGRKGGGVYVDSRGTFTSTNSTISGNSGRMDGGGVWGASRGTITLTNSILAQNYRGNYYGSISDMNNLIDEDPKFICAPDFDESGVLLNADTLDLRLQSDSPAIDQGDNDSAYAVSIRVSDIAGAPRFYGDVIDIGAYEFNPLVVNTLNDSTDPSDSEWSLREVIAYARACDTITFAEGLNGKIELALGELVIDKSLTINGAGRIIIDAGGKSRVATVSAGAADASVLFNGLTFQNGSAEYGGAIKNSGVLTLNDVAFQANKADKNGGAIFNDFGATLTINGGCFSSNSANNGGAFANYGTLEISDSEGVATTISENNANRFGGAYFGCGELTVDGSATFESNTAGIKGGAIYNDVNKSDVDNPRAGKVTINGDGVSFEANTAGERGGAIQTYSTLNIGGTATFSGNQAGEYGGAIDVGEGGAAALSGVLTFNDNAADFGGAIFSVGALKFESGEENQYAFACNTANKSGGAIDALAGTLTLGGKFEFALNKANGTYDEDSTGLGGALAIATLEENTTVDGASFSWEGNSAEKGNCVAFKNDCGISAETFGLEDAADYVMFDELVENVNSLQSLLPRSISPNAVEATIMIEGVKTTFGAEGVTPQQLGLGVGTHEALVQYVDANGGTSAAYVLKLTVVPGASVEVRETAIADGRGVKFDFNLTKADGGAVSVWEISWGDGSTTRSDNLSESWLAAHYYAQDGTFDVSLKVVYLDGTSETFEAFSTQKIGATVAKTEALSAVFEDVDDLFEDAFVEFENPNVYGPAFLR